MWVQILAHSNMGTMESLRNLLWLVSNFNSMIAHFVLKGYRVVYRDAFSIVR